MKLVKGQKAKIRDLTDSESITVELQISSDSNLVFDISCFGLDDEDKCSDDRYFIFYNHHESPCSGLRLSGSDTNGHQSFAINLAKLHEKIKKLVFTVTIDGAGVMSDINQGEISLFDTDRKNFLFFRFYGKEFMDKKAIMVGEIYFKNEWRLGAIGQGFNGGLSALLEHFGIEEEEAQTDEGELKSTGDITIRDTSIIDPSRVSSSNDRNQSDTNENRRSQSTDNKFGFFKGIASKTVKFVGQKKNLRKFKELLIDYLSDGVLTHEEMKSLETFCDANDLNTIKALEQSKPEIENFLHSMLADIVSDGIVTEDEETALVSVCQFLNPSNQIQRELWDVINRVKHIEKVRSGNIEPVQEVSLITKMDEIVWCERINATLVRELKRGDEHHGGGIYVTSERVIFDSRDYPLEILLKNIVKIEGYSSKLYIVGKTKRSTCGFLIHQGDVLEAYVDQAVNKFHRKLNLQQTNRKTRTISQSVKQKVWLRDQGKCIECSATEYLEFDHIIPFAKGGSNSENNIQLLCRKCNLKKSDSL